MNIRDGNKIDAIVRENERCISVAVWKFKKFENTRYNRNNGLLNLLFKIYKFDCIKVIILLIKRKVQKKYNTFLYELNHLKCFEYFTHL